jgi:hypothetical protein
VSDTEATLQSDKIVSGDAAEPLDAAQITSADETMDIHKPKPVHSLRELASEVGVIVIGIVIALLGEQAVEALHWNHKVEAARVSLDEELGRDLAYADEQQVMKTCARRYLDVLESAIVHNDAAVAQTLRDHGSPLDLQPWQVDAWDAALDEQIADHLSRKELTNYAIAFRSIATERELQFQMFDHFNEAMTVRYGLPNDAGVEQARLAALGKLRTEEAVVLAISRSLVGDYGPKLGVKPEAALIVGVADKAKACLALTQTLGAKSPAK